MKPTDDTQTDISGPQTYDDQDVRQGRIVISRYWQRWIFFGGLAGVGIFALLILIFGTAS
ncbi:hypothetical protein [Ponticaulis profundi]|uniref:Uncharacterized protein n=1 Tax=Ponticaulis profundi TaxID=2665222 RepID=A0ABW1SA93_9PROT|tara:strand:+ start:380 stop:559 length:180 start_codon:yes stop_codon:yes gene_type:complete